MTGKNCSPTPAARTMQQVFGRAPPNPTNLAKKLSGAPSPSPPMMKKGKK